jgi:lipopolysaccharide/colanic/teichoic acid biosynthesis glycosyltransferase
MKQRPSKRVFDLIFTTMFLIILSPVLIIIALLLKLEGLIDPSYRGPVIYSESRISGGKLFRIHKFRTVRSAIFEDLESHRIPGSISQFTGGYSKKKTATLTPVGRLLSLVYFDELPQLFNILKGEMSLVGPRPLVPEHYNADLAQSMISLRYLKGGLFGFIQASKGDSKLRAAFARRANRSRPQALPFLDLDRYYLYKFRKAPALELMLLDLWIMWRCLFVVAKAEGL